MLLRKTSRSFQKRRTSSSSLGKLTLLSTGLNMARHLSWYKKARPLKDELRSRYHPSSPHRGEGLSGGHAPTSRGYAPACANGGFRPILLARGFQSAARGGFPGGG